MILERKHARAGRSHNTVNGTSQRCCCLLLVFGVHSSHLSLTMPTMKWRRRNSRRSSAISTSCSLQISVRECHLRKIFENASSSTPFFVVLASKPIALRPSADSSSFANTSAKGLGFSLYRQIASSMGWLGSSVCGMT